jgi:type III secretion system TyeA family effector delivery regulator
MAPSITSFQSAAVDVMANAVKSSLDDVIGTYQGRKITAGGKNPSEAGLDFNDATRFFQEAEQPAPLKSQSRQAADAKAQRLRSAIGKVFPEMQGSAALTRFMALLRRMQRENRFDELGEEMEKLFPDPSVRFGVARAMSSDLSDGGGGGQDDSLREKLEQVAERLEKEHGPDIAAGNNISPVLNEFVSTRPSDAGDVREGYRRAVFDYKTPADAYRFIATNLAKFTGEGTTPGPVSSADGEDFEQRLGVALDFLSNALAADLAATKPSGEPSQLREVVDGLQQVRFLGNAHESCRGLLTKFHNSTRESVPVAPFRLMTSMLDAAKGERVSENEFTRLAMDFNVPPLEPSINFMTQFRDIVRTLPARAFDKTETRERVLDSMQKAIDQFIDEEEVALG